MAVIGSSLLNNTSVAITIKDANIKDNKQKNNNT